MLLQHGSLEEQGLHGFHTHYGMVVHPASRHRQTVLFCKGLLMSGCVPVSYTHLVYEWFDADSNCLTEVSYLLVGYVNVVKFF